VLSGCFLDRSGLGGGTDAGPIDAGPLPDGTTGDGGDDVDGGPLPACSHRGRARSVATLGATELRAGTTTAAVIEDPGVLTLPVQTYANGALLWTGYEDDLLDDGSPAFSDLVGASPRFSALLRDHDVDFGFGRPQGLDVNGDDTFSIEIRGELYLRAGVNDFDLQADDRMIVELDLGGSIVRGGAVWTGGSTMTVNVPADGWYPVHAAMEEVFVTSRIRIALRAPGETAFRDLRPDEMRVDARDLEGRVAYGWDVEGWSAAPDGSRIDAERTDVSFAAAPPRELGIADRSAFALRWFGMHRFGAPGAALAVSVEKRFYIFVDGTYLGDGDGDGSYDVGFAPGWHEVVMLMAQDGGNDGRARLTYDGSVFEPASMRARPRSGGAVFGEGIVVDRTVDAATEYVQPITVAAPALVPSFVEISAIVSTADPRAVTMQWVGPDGGAPRGAVLADAARRIEGTDAWHFRAMVDDATTANGAWSVRLTNDSDAAARWTRAGVLAQLAGARDAYPRTGEWTSAAIALDDDYALERAVVSGEIPGGTGARVQVRAADTASALGSATAVDVDADGFVMGAASGRFAQLVVTLEGDGTITPRVTGLALFGRPCASCATTRCGPWSTPGAIAIYELDESSGTVARDTAGITPRLDLEVAEAARVHRAHGALVFDRPAIAEGNADAVRIAGACATTDEVTLEAWVTAADPAVTEMRPARILAISQDQNEQNILLGQEPDGTLTLRITTADAARVELTSTATIGPGELTHLVLTRAADGTVRLTMNGAVVIDGTASGALSAWRGTDRVVIGDERVGDRGWLGAVHLAAIYSRALDASEIAAHYAIGPDGGT
jgi:hypothetical protein